MTETIVQMAAEPDVPEGAVLVRAMVKQAMADLDNPDGMEREDAIAFLTETLWDGDPEGLPLRDLDPEFFLHETEMRARISRMIAGEIDLVGPLVDGDGAVSYDDVLALLLSEVEGASSEPEPRRGQ